MPEMYGDDVVELMRVLERTLQWKEPQATEPVPESVGATAEEILRGFGS